MQEGALISTNPLLSSSVLPQFANIKAEDVLPALEQTLTDLRRQLRELEQLAEPVWESVMVPLAQMDEQLDRLWGPVVHLNAVCDSDELRAVYQQGVAQVTEWHAELSRSRALYLAVKGLQERGSASLSRVQRQAVAHAVRDFRLSGVALDSEAQEELRSIELKLSSLATRFEQHLLDATRAFSLLVTDRDDLRGLPLPLQEAAAARARDEGSGDGWLFTLDIPSYLPFMQYGESRALRERLYRAFVTRASRDPLDNTPVIEEILQQRDAMAKLLGFQHYADYSLARKMAGSVDEVVEFLSSLAERARPAAEQEWQLLEQFARDNLDLPELAAWDIPFASERLRQQRYQVDQQQLRPWFPQERVLQGLFVIAERLYGITISAADAPLWHEDVSYYEVKSRDGVAIASFWLDPYARPHKRGGAWMDECRVRWRLPDGSLQLPVAYLVCNFDRPVGGQQALWTHDEVVTLFHEFGHGLHHLLTEIDVRALSGINGVPWDAVELPSQFMENYCWQPEGLALISSHVDDGSPLPEELRQRLVAAKNFQSGLQTLRQIEFALFDLRLHAGFAVDGKQRVAELLDEVRSEVAVVKPPPFNRFECGFAHIFAGGYAAGYYSYKWAELLAADAFAAFEEAGVFDETTACRFHRELLSVGGSRDMMEAFVAFRGARPSLDSLLRHSGLLADTA
ncbi:MAG: M3 family metallopeptidase [Mariprofundales bacterium]|nr:M3 family metallopeptidase [Mariprofundales bacterium]